MWKSKRQTKKHKTKQRPKFLAQVFFCIVGCGALVFIVFFVLSLVQEPTLVLPVASGKSTEGVKTQLLSGGGTEEIERGLKEKNIPFLFVTTASQSSFVVTLANNAEVIMKKEDLPAQIASLQLITHRLTMEGKRFSRLDLRFDRPVVLLSK